MSKTARHIALPDLLTRAGARIRGHGRADCPRCRRLRAVSFDESKGVYHCHGAGCGFSGGAAKLSRELGLAERLRPAEYRELRRNWTRADQAARVLYERVKAQRLHLNEVHRECLDLIRLAHGVGATETAWDALAIAYERLPQVRAELLALENAHTAEAVAILNGGAEWERLLLKAASMDDGPGPMCR